MAVKKAYFCTALTGGGEGALDSLDGSILHNQDTAFVTILGELKDSRYILDEDSGLAESSPDVIAPDFNAGDKRWILSRSELASTERPGYCPQGDGNATHFLNGNLEWITVLLMVSILASWDIVPENNAMILTPSQPQIEVTITP